MTKQKLGLIASFEVTILRNLRIYDSKGTHNFHL